MSTESLIQRGQADLRFFYSPYFNTQSKLEAFLHDALDYEKGSLAKRQMLYQVQRFVSLATDIDKLRPGRDGLRIMFIRICLESLCSLSNDSKKNNKLFYETFINCFSDEGKQYILNNFKLSSFDDEICGYLMEVSHDLTMMDFFEIIRITRNQVVHEGVYWEMQYFALADEFPLSTTMATKDRFLKTYTYQCQEERDITYHFETTLKYENFIYYFIEACVNYIEKVEVI